MEEIGDALRRVKTNEATVFSGDFNAHVGNDSGVWRDVIGKHVDADISDNGRLLLQLCCNYALYIMNTFLQQIFARVHLEQRFVWPMTTH